MPTQDCNLEITFSVLKVDFKEKVQNQKKSAAFDLPLFA